VYVCRNFDIRELVPYGVWKNTDNKQLLWWLFDDRMLKVADKLRDAYGKMVGNDWAWGGDKKMCGFRPWESETGSRLSQHKFGRAFDSTPYETDVKVIRQDIIDRKHPFMEEIKGLELGVSWLHFDLRNSNELVTFRP